MPRWIAGLLGGITAAALVLLALLADRAGPLEAHPPTVSVRPPPPATLPTAPPVTAPSSAAPPRQVQPDGSWVWIILAVIGGLLLVLAVVLLIRALRRPGRITAPPLAPGSAALAPTVLGWLDEDEQRDQTDARSFDPRRAADEIIAAWTALESAATAAGHRRKPASTPTEFVESLAGWFHEPGGHRRADPMSRTGGYGGDGPPGGTATADRASGGGVMSTAEASAVLLRLYHRARFDTAALAPESAGRARAAARVLGVRLQPPAEPRSAGPDDPPGRPPGGADAPEMRPGRPEGPEWPGAGPGRGGRHR